MSTTYSIVCHETKQYLWIGQSTAGAEFMFYSGEPETMKRLGRFLQATIGKTLVVLQDDSHDFYPGYAEFESNQGAPP